MIMLVVLFGDRSSSVFSSRSADAQAVLTPTISCAPRVFMVNQSIMCSIPPFSVPPGSTLFEQIDWGDGTPAMAVPRGAASVIGHAYQAPGTFVVRYTVAACPQGSAPGSPNCATGAATDTVTIQPGTPTATPTPTPSPAATSAPSPTPSPAASPTPTATATTAPTATATATTAPTVIATPPPSPVRTATATATPARTATAVPSSVAQQLQPDCPAQYMGGARQLVPAMPTRILVTCTVTNRTNEMVDYAGTMTFTLGEQASVVGGGAMRGMVAVVGNEIRWSGFALAPGESATATAEVEVLPSARNTGQTVVIFTNTRTTARLASGGFVDISSGEVTTGAVSGLTGGGLVQAPPSTTGPGGPVATAVPGGPAPVPARPPAVTQPGAALPRVGAGQSQEDSPWSMMIGMGLAGVVVLSVAGAAVAARRRM